MPLFYATPTIARQGVVAGFVLLPPGLNLVFNPYFEKGIGWTWVNAFLDTSFYETTVAFCNSSIRLNLGTSPAASVTETTPHPVTPTQVYNLAVDALSAGYPGETNTPPATAPASWTNLSISGPHQPTGTMELQAVFVNSGGSVLSTSTVATLGATGGQWVTMSGSVTVPSGAAGMLVQIALSGETQEDWWVDNAVLHLQQSPFVPGITLGVLFAQGTMYRPSLPPTLPAAAASQQSWLWYNSSTGFYWTSTFAPTTSDDAFLGWVRASATGIVAQSTRRIGTGLPEVVTPIGPVLPASSALAGAAAANVAAATAAVNAVAVGDIPYYQFSGTATMPGDTSNLAAVHVVMIDVTGGGSVDHEVYTFRAPLTAGAVLNWLSDLFPTPQGGSALTFKPEFRSENLDGTITLPAVDESNLTVNPVAPVVDAPVSVVCSEAGPRTLQPVSPHYTYTVLAVTVNEPSGTLTALIPGTRLRVAISSDGGTTWLDQGFFTSNRGPLVGGYYQTVIDIQILVFSTAKNWIARVYAAGATYDPGWTAAVTTSPVSIAGIGLPAATLITTLNVVAGTGPTDFPYNVPTPDGIQYFEIGDFSFDDSPALGDPYGYFCRVTLQDCDASHNPVGPERPFAGQQTTGGTQHTGPVDGAYGTVGGSYTRTGNVAYVRARLYVCNSLNQTSQSFADPTCGSQQTGVGSGAGHIDVLVASGGATPSGQIQATRLAPATLHPTIGPSPSGGLLAARGSAQSMLLDFDFELSETGLNPANSAWSFSGSCTIEQDGTAYSGKNYCRITSANPLYSVAQQSLAVRAGETLYLSLYGRSSNTTPGTGQIHDLLYYMQFFDATGAFLTSVGFTTLSPALVGYISDWTLTEATVPVPANAATGTVVIYTDVTEVPGGYWDIDSVRLEPVKRAASLHLGAGMHDDGSGNAAVNPTGPIGFVGTQLTVLPAGITNAYIGSAAVAAVNMAMAAVTYANQALAANSVIASNVASTNIGSLVAGTVVFSAGLTLSRGSGLPVIAMDSGGIFLYGNGTASGSAPTPGVSGGATFAASGLTSYGYVGIQFNQIGIYGQASGGVQPSVIVGGSNLTLWSNNGSTVSPYATLNSSNLTLYAGSSGYYAQVNANGLYVYAGSYSLQAYASGIVMLASGGPAAYLLSSGLTLYSVNGNTSFPYAVISSTSGLALYNGSSSVVLGPSSITFTNGTGGQSVSINSSGLALNWTGSAVVTIAASSAGLADVFGSMRFNSNLLLGAFSFSNIKLQFPSGTTIGSGAYTLYGYLQAISIGGSSYSIPLYF